MGSYVFVQKSLFGVPIPDGAVKATIKPALGRGQTKAMWQGAIERDGCPVEETDIIAEVADNMGFWSYVDLQVQAKRIAQKDPYVWAFKVLVVFEDQAGVKTEAAQSSEEIEFFRRGGQATSSQADQSLNRMLTVLEKLVVELPQRMHEHTVQYHEKVASAGLKTIEETGKQAAAAACAIVQAASGPLQAALDANNKAFEKERERFESSIKLNMRMLEAKKETSVFEEVGKLAPLVPMVKTLLN